MDIKDILQPADSELTAVVEYREGIKFTLRYIGRAELQKMARLSTIQKYDTKLKARTPQLDNEKLIEAYCRKAVVAWEGVTPRSISKVALVNFGKVPADKLDEAIAFSADGLVALVKSSDDLDMFLQDSCSNVQTFNSEHEAELGNSEPSPTGN
jgi:hypothetical protein